MCQGFREMWKAQLVIPQDKSKCSKDPLKFLLSVWSCVGTHPQRPRCGMLREKNVVSYAGESYDCWLPKMCLVVNGFFIPPLSLWLPFLDILYIRWPPVPIPLESLQSAQVREIKRNHVVNSKEQSTPGRNKSFSVLGKNAFAIFDNKMEGFIFKLAELTSCWKPQSDPQSDIHSCQWEAPLTMV